jgi:ribosome-associated protein
LNKNDEVIRASHSELDFDFVRSAGPGGQNVNKVATSVQLRFNVGASPNLANTVKQRLIRLAGRKITSDGVLIIEARRYRTQDQNRADAIARFDALLSRAMEEPKRRLPTKATIASRQRRLESKKRRGEIKRSRRIPADES